MHYDPRCPHPPSPWPRRFVLALPFLAAGALLLASTLLTGCASVIDGTSQVITIKTDALAASCTGTRQGEYLFRVSGDSDRAIVSKSRHAIDLACSAPGYDDAQQEIRSSISALGIASMVAFDFGLTDYATGALNKYPSAITITLKPKAAP